MGKEADAVLAPSDAVRREMEWRWWALGWIRDGRGGVNAASSTSAYDTPLSRSREYVRNETALPESMEDDVSYDTQKHRYTRIL